MNSYERSDGKMLYECDEEGCHESSEFYGSWSECVQEAKEEGWKAYKFEEDWFHTCPSCNQKGKDPREVFG